MSSSVLDGVTRPIIIDTDTHFVEPRDLWTSRLPKKWADETLTVRWDDRIKAEAWWFGDRPLHSAWIPCAYGRERKFGELPATEAECHPATVNQAERVSLMDGQLVRSAVLYPNVEGLNPHLFISIRPEVSVAHVSAYNDYQFEWSANFPGRFIPMVVVPYWEMRAAVAEIERMAGKGFGGIVMTGAPHLHGQPRLADPHWDPLWQATVDAGLSVSFHNGNASSMVLDPKEFKLDVPGTSIARHSIGPFLDNGKQISDLLLSGILVRYPDLNFVSVESGVGWVPFLLEALDYYYMKERRFIEVHPWGDMLPSDLFRRQVYVNCWFEHLEQWHIDAIGLDNIMFETDFPHPVSLGPKEVQESIVSGLAQHPRQVQEKILWKNAERLYHLDPAEDLVEQGVG